MCKTCQISYSIEEERIANMPALGCLDLRVNHHPAMNKDYSGICKGESHFQNVYVP